MKITNVQAVYPKYQRPLAAWRAHFWQIAVQIETDTGTVGWGYGGGGVAAVEVVNRHYRELLIGRQVNSTADIADIWDILYQASLPYGRRGIAIMALSGIDLALWDLLARAEQVPVYRLIGGRRKERVRAYATGNDPEWYAAQGYTAHKFSQGWNGEPASFDAAVHLAERSRRSLGPGALLMVDCYMAWDAAVALEMASRLAEFNIYWFEDLLTPDQLQEQAALRPALQPIKIAGGEHEFTHYGFAEIARSRALDIWQPDVTWCGGITALLRILELAREAGVQVIPHRGGEVWGLHPIVATDCADLAEWLPGNPQEATEGLWLGQPEPINGLVVPADSPGFGVTVNENLL